LLCHISLSQVLQKRYGLKRLADKFFKVLDFLLGSIAHS
jgi:hypothetical protein